MLSQIEGQTKPIIEDLVEGKALDLEQRFRLSRFIALLFARTPKFEREITLIADRTHKEIAKEMIPSVEAAARLLAKSGGGTSTTAEGLYDCIHQERFRVTGHRNIALEYMIEFSQKAAKQLFAMNWQAVHPPDNRAFITSDSPFGYMVPEHLKKVDRPILGILSDEIIKVIPLAPSVALCIGALGRDFFHSEANRQELAEINLAVAKECDRFLFGSNQDQVRNVVERSRIDTTQPGTTLKVESVTHPKDPKRSFLVTRRVAADKSNHPFNPQNLLGIL